ncbi:hypothetical protein DUNSADRAFT_17805 [Dunaliella salina]|uniref:Vps72/YL1 C-terminal domain-containing protein n=1 Tax=Dunaliella salina TaxID=3046 RepID=A0ABQ7GZN4_DUNSA|nr:hypothetical protein DUNSADRAFT_17805 [Dunaliella salina]|eukprot:KAF5840070.1 hypothetical protein DUNSADRAFT_17805 [Dunaliella salina]
MCAAADTPSEGCVGTVECVQSLKLLMAMEEATKRKAAVVKQHYAGPLVKFVSKRRLKEVQPGQEEPGLTHTGPAAPGQPSPPKTAPAAPQTGHPSTLTPAQTPRGPAPQTPAPGAPPANGPTSAAIASTARPSQPSETLGVGGEAAGLPGAQTPAPTAAAAGGVRGSNAEGNAEAGGARSAATTSTPASGMDIDGSGSDIKREAGPHAAVKGATTATPMSGTDVDGRDGTSGGVRPHGDGATGEQGGGGEDAAAAAEAAAAKAARDLENDGRRYEGTVSYEICNMPYPPMWLRRFRALPPPAVHKCAITGMPARYRDPATGRAYANPAAFRRLHPERQVTPTQPLPLDQVRYPS